MAINIGAIHDKGGNRAFLSEVSDAFVLKTAALGTTSKDLGALSASNPKQTTSKTEYKSEDGKVQKSDYEYVVELDATLMETDKALIDFLSDTVKGKYYLLGKYNGIVDSKKQEIFLVGQVTPQMDINMPGAASSNKFNFTAIFPPTTVSFTSTQLASIETALTYTIYCTGVAITNSQGFVIKETP